MNSEEIFPRLADVIADVLEIDAEDVTENLGYDTCEDWDSLAQITILVSVENEFGVKFDAKEMTSLNTVRAIVETLKNIEE